ncbi:MAG: RnfABCDGE type electron transport complex subunit G [Oscillospiraceae bacterium]|nr:RnfABCDGE type electron transport complex subunit G [Oscillospiraceae bacterium]
MKKDSSVKEILRPAIMLFLIGAVCTALLAGTNLLTKDKIAEISAQTENEAKAAVLSEADSFSEEKTVSVESKEYTYFEGTKNGEIKGYVIPVTTKSYGGDLSLIVGIDSESSKITGVEITSINDTAGLGMKAKNADFLEQYFGKTAGIGVNKNTPSGNEIQAITGATITSKAVTEAVNTAFSVYSEIKAGDTNG